MVRFMESKITKFIFKQDIDVLFTLLLIMLYTNSKLIVWFSIVYCFIRFYTLNHFVLMIFLNYITFTSIASNCMSFSYGNVKNTLVIFSFISLFIVLILSQAFTILIKAFSNKLEVPPIFKRWQLRFLSRFIFLFDIVYYIASIILAVVYPIIVSMMIITIFAGSYNSINNYHELRSEEDGIYYSATDMRLKSKADESDIVGLSNLEFLIENDYAYFSTTTFFTIGYGDITPRGSIAKSMTMLQMIISNITGISIFALYGTLFYNYIGDKKVIRNTERYMNDSDRSSIV